MLAVSVMQTLGEQVELWLAFETGKHFRYLAAYKVDTNILWPKKLQLSQCFMPLLAVIHYPVL